VQLYGFGKRGRPRFKGRNRLHSVEGKANTVIRYRDGMVHWGKLSIPVMFDPRDKHGWQRAALEASLKYVRVVRRRIRGRDRWYAQLVVGGQPPRKPHHVLGTGTVGLDLGPSTIATVSATHASLPPRMRPCGASARP
jgi:putative transposase